MHWTAGKMAKCLAVLSVVLHFIPQMHQKLSPNIIPGRPMWYVCSSNAI